MIHTNRLARALAWGSQAGRREILVLAMMAVPAGLLAIFLALASEVAEGETAAFDKALLLGLRNPADLSDPLGPPWVELAMRDITALGGVTVVTMVTVSAIGYLLVSRRHTIALLVAASIGSGAVLSQVLKTVYARPRPDLVAHSVDVFSLSFPSGHALQSALTYLTLGALLATIEREPARRGYILAVAILLTLAIGVSRVYLGVHYPTDVLAGWSIGAAWAMLWLGVARLVRRHRRHRSHGKTLLGGHGGDEAADGPVRFEADSSPSRNMSGSGRSR